MPRDVPYGGPALIPQFPNHSHDGTKKSSLRIEVRWLKDPVKLANHTVKLLHGDDFEKALEIVRLASKNVECTVSWNHLIDYEMSKARVTNAVKLYNEASSYLVHRSAYIQG